MFVMLTPVLSKRKYLVLTLKNKGFNQNSFNGLLSSNTHIFLFLWGFLNYDFSYLNCEKEGLCQVGKKIGSRRYKVRKYCKHLFCGSFSLQVTSLSPFFNCKFDNRYFQTSLLPKMSMELQYSERRVLTGCCDSTVLVELSTQHR